MQILLFTTFDWFVLSNTLNNMEKSEHMHLYFYVTTGDCKLPSDCNTDIRTHFLLNPNTTDIIKTWKTKFNWCL